MCRNIKTLYNFDPPATDAEIRGAAAARILLSSLATSAEPHNREVEAARARARAIQRFNFSGAHGQPPQAPTLPA